MGRKLTWLLAVGLLSCSLSVRGTWNGTEDGHDTGPDGADMDLEAEAHPDVFEVPDLDPDDRDDPVEADPADIPVDETSEAVEEELPPENWLEGWDNRVRLTIGEGDIDEDLYDFPVLLHLGDVVGPRDDDVSFVFHELLRDANRKKIAVTTDDGMTQCTVEIERWDSAGEQAWLWVRAPYLDDETDTVLYLYFDADQTANTDFVDDTNMGNSHLVWDSNFRLVYHLSETAGSHYDSTSNDSDGTAYNGTNQDGAGIAAGADVFDGVDDYVDMPDLGTQTRLTVEVWFFGYGPWVTHNPLVSHAEWFSGVIHLKLKADGTDVPGELVCLSQAGDRLASGVPHDTEVWTYAAYTVDGVGSDRFKLYVDAVEMASGDANVTDLDVDFMFGREWIDRYFYGALDEVRISDIARRPAWLKATSETVRDHLVSYGGLESLR